MAEKFAFIRIFVIFFEIFKMVSIEVGKLLFAPLVQAVEEMEIVMPLPPEHRPAYVIGVRLAKAWTGTEIGQLSHGLICW